MRRSSRSMIRTCMGGELRDQSALQLEPNWFRGQFLVFITMARIGFGAFFWLLPAAILLAVVYVLFFSLVGDVSENPTVTVIGIGFLSTMNLVLLVFMAGPFFSAYLALIRVSGIFGQRASRAHPAEFSNITARMNEQYKCGYYSVFGKVLSVNSTKNTGGTSEH